MRILLSALTLGAAITALLWLSYSFATTHRSFGATVLPAALNLAASIAAATLFIVLVTQVFLRYGFERMLHTEPTELQRRLVGEGYRVRIYVPFGTHWAGYFYRRVMERRENALFALRSLISR